MTTRMMAGAALLAVIGLVVAQSVSAVEIKRYDGYYTGIGGEFTVFGTGYEDNYDTDATVTKPVKGTGFQTFCLEKNENQTQFPTDYTIEYYAVEGGVAGSDPNIGGDPLSVGTSWLYWQFSAGMLFGYDYAPGAGRESSAADLQEAFWWLEEELAYDASGNQFVLWAGTSLQLDDAGLKADAAPNQNQVAVVNFTKDGAHKQSMLVRVPDGGLTVALLGMGLIGCGILRRRLS